ncbi:nuclear transport factor 2 family protein [Pseudomonas citronellolis]|uniref:nuclear transport factor 2 family protein n=1 Tax=Pseudomonas citronellolis TaxID=53408 RepID=UPI0023E39C40|nr:nuclear transport factor 2 family protein [Pseudomonas citronellolis]MDF3934043.1 nuclear transport factor 2 family protein [Pseudomonas citronellolis]
MAHPNAELIDRFYQAFQRRDGDAMAACYAPRVRFHDPAFGELNGRDAGDMWRMLTRRAADLSLEFDQVWADEREGGAHWVARYTFSQTGRVVVNRIQARFVFADGLIVAHDDSFDFWRWARQALGVPGLLLGWAPPLRAAIRRKARQGLAAFQARERDVSRV